MTGPTLQEMCAVIAEGWTAIRYLHREWTAEEVFNADPRGELFWIPEQYAKSLAYLGRTEELEQLAKAVTL